MKTKYRSVKKRLRRGMAYVIALIFVAVFSALSVAMFTMSGSNLMVAKNYQESNLARSTAESGLQYVTHWMNRVEIPGTTALNYLYPLSKAGLLAAMDTAQVPYTENGTAVHIGSAGSPIILDADRSFWAEVWPDGTNGIHGVVHGRAGVFERSIQAKYTYGPRADSVFDYGVATKGPLSLQGNVQLDDVQEVVVKSNVYIESELYDNALHIQGNSQIAGDVKITNPDATVTLQGGKAGIGGETGQDAIDNHVETGAAPTSFPTPNPGHFERYVNGVTIDSGNVSQYVTSGATLNNVRIAPNTNPKFNNNIKINGVLYIESPNVVDFSGNCTITGIIVGDGDVNDNSGANQLIFRGNVSSRSVKNLPYTSEFAGLHDETGTFLMAPGFAVSFGGNFDTLNGCIAANGVEFFGNAGGEIAGSVINYSPHPMELSGNSDLYFNRTGIVDLPAGFIARVVLRYKPDSYTELH